MKNRRRGSIAIDISRSWPAAMPALCHAVLRAPDGVSNPAPRRAPTALFSATLKLCFGNTRGQHVAQSERDANNDAIRPVALVRATA